MNDKTNECEQIIDNKMKELLQNFVYLEEKKIFNSESIYSFLTKKL